MVAGVTAHIVNISGGKDSTATYLLAVERGRPFRAVWADTGHEHPATVEYINALSARTGGPEVTRVAADFSARIAGKRRFIEEHWPEAGVPQARVDRALEVLQPTGIPFLDLCLWKGRFPSASRRFCTEELKSKPFQEQVLRPALDAGDVVQWLGLRRNESAARAETPRVRRVRWISPRRTLVYFCPIAFWEWNAVFGMHERHGLRPNPLYAKGASRVGCWPCIMARKAELAMISGLDPAAVERLLEWEVLVADASKRGAATFFAGGVTPEGAAMARAGLSGAIGGPQYPDAAAIFTWARTSRGGRQLDLLAGAECVSEYGMCE